MPPENVSQQLTEHMTTRDPRLADKKQGELAGTFVFHWNYFFSVVSHDASGVDGTVYTNGLLWLFIVFPF